MRHRVAGRKLGRSSEHRVAMLRNLSAALFEKERIRTTLMKAKELRPFAEKLITLSKRETLHARRLILRDIHDKSVVAKLFDTLSPRYAERPGGYTRIIKLGPRRGDNAEMALIELVGGLHDTGKPVKTTKKSAASRKKTASKVSDKAAPAAAKESKPRRKAKTAKTAKTTKKTKTKAKSEGGAGKKTAKKKTSGKTVKKKAASKKASGDK